MPPNSIFDEIDQTILALLQADARMANVDIARHVAMAPSAVLERIRKLEDRGIIRGYAARLSPGDLGFGLLAFVFVRSEGGVWQGDFAQTLSHIPEVQEVHHIAGEDCFLVKVRTRDTASLGQLIRDSIGSLPSVRSTRTTIVLETAKETMDLPVAAMEGVKRK